MNRNEIERQISDLAELDYSDISNVGFPLYHYTGVEGIAGILGDSNFYISKSDFLNDRTEIVHFNNMCEDAIKEIIGRRPLSIKVERFSYFCGKFSDYLKEKNDSFKDDLFVLSFTSNSDLLPLWSFYTNNIGYNIGFKRSILDNFKNQVHDFLLGHVIYDEDQQYQLILVALEEAFKIWVKVGKEGLTIKLTKYIFESLFTKFRLYSMFFKNRLFSSEEEIRFIFKESDTNRIFHRCKNGILIPYIKVQFNTECVQSVCIGPINNLDNAEIGLKSFLKSNNYEKIKIDKSQIPLRY